MSKLAIVAAGAVGYLFGSRSGREPYEKFAEQADRIRQDPRVQSRVEQVKEATGQRAGSSSSRGPQGKLP